MLTPLFRLEEAVVALEVLPQNGLVWDRHRAVVRAADGSCAPCILTVPHANHLVWDESQGVFDSEVARCGQFPRAAPLLLHAFHRAGVGYALAERAPPPLSLDAVRRALAGAHQQARVALGVQLLGALARIGAEIAAVCGDEALAAVRLPMNDQHFDFDGSVFVRPRWFSGSPQIQERPGPPPLDMRGMAPESALGKVPTPQTALFSMAWSVFELLALQDPTGLPRGTPLIHRLGAVVQGPLHPISRYRPDLPPPFSSLLDAMLSRLPVDRPADLAAVLSTVDGLAAAEDPAGDGAAAAQLTQLFPLVREQAAQEAAELAATRFDDLLARCDAVDGVSEGLAAPPQTARSKKAASASPAALQKEADEIVWSGDGRRMRRVAPRLLVDEQPVSCAGYARFLDATGRHAPSDWPQQQMPAGRAERPVVLVSLEDARAYARWAGKRLPLNEDWIAAMRTAGFATLGGGQVWEWTASRQQSGHVVRGGRYRDRHDVEPTLLHASWEDGPAEDLGFRCVADA